MAAVRTYGIPRVIEAHEIFFFNDGAGQLPIMFSGGIPDPKYAIPATYSTANEFEQIVIENSTQFGNRVFRYGPKGEVISTKSTIEVAKAAATKGGRKTAATVDDTKTYNNVETIGEATEVLLDLGAKADDLNGQDAVISTMMRMKVSFPNLKF